jgi:hypothetical protein
VSRCSTPSQSIFEDKNRFNYGHCIICPVKVKKYRKNNIYWRFIQNHHRTLSRTIPKTVKASRRTTTSVLIIPPIEFCNRQNIFDYHQKFRLAAQQRVSLKTPTANESTYLRAGTKTIFNDSEKKSAKKHEYILFSRYISLVPRRKCYW